MAAALYLDILFAAYNDPQMVLAEYNGGPVNAGYYRADVAALAAETRNYVPRVLELYARLKDQFETGPTLQAELYNDGRREGKLLGVRAPRSERSAPAPARTSGAAAESAASPSAR